MRNVGLAIGAAVLLMPVAGTAQVGTPDAAAVSTPAAGAGKTRADPNKMVCRTMETTGSRLNKTRQCKTANDWAAQAALDRQAIDRQQASRWRQDN